MNMPESTKLSVIVVNYEMWCDVLGQVEILAASSAVREGRAELLVVDNASPEGPPARRSANERVIWIDRSENGGFAAGVNTGWRQTKGEWLLLLNPDVDVTVDLLGHVLALLDEIDRGWESRGSNVGIVGVALTNPDGSRQPSVGTFPSVGRGFLELFLPRSRRRYQIVSPQKFGPVDWVTGAFFLVRSQVMEELGGFDEDFFLYFEETDFCLRAKRAGWFTCFAPSISVCHRKPLQNRAVSPKMRLLTRHSRLLYFRKHSSAMEFRVMMGLVSMEARARCLLASLGFRKSDEKAWKAIRELARFFRNQKEPLGMQVRDWADRRLD